MKNERSIGTGRMKLMVVLFSICALTISQEPAKEKKKDKPTHFQGTVQDTTASERLPDTLYMKQSIALDRLDSLIQKKQKK